MLICENSNCAAVETGESLKIQQCSKPQPTIAFLLTQTFSVPTAESGFNSPDLTIVARSRYKTPRLKKFVHGSISGDCTGLRESPI